MLICNEEPTTLQPSDIMMFREQTLSFARGGRRITIADSLDPTQIDDKFFYGTHDLCSRRKLAETIAFLTDLEAEQIRLSDTQTAYQFLPSGHLQHDPDIAIRPNDVICYSSVTRDVWFLRNQMKVDVGIRRLPEFFCFAKLLALILGYDLRKFHETPSELHLQFVKR